MKPEQENKIDEKEDVFNPLVDEWVRLSLCYSNISESLKLEPAQKILNMGWKAMPWIYERMLSGGDHEAHLYIFLEALGIKPDLDPLETGHLAFIQKAFIDKGIYWGYITPEEVKRWLGV